MKKKTVMALILSLLLMFSVSVTAFADSSTTATVPVTLTVSNEYRSVNVTVPASLPIYVTRPRGNRSGSLFFPPGE